MFSHLVPITCSNTELVFVIVDDKEWCRATRVKLWKMKKKKNQEMFFEITAVVNMLLKCAS